MNHHDRRLWITAFIVAVVTVAVFWPSQNNNFLFWDDNINFLNNPYYRGLGWEQIRWMFTSRTIAHYHPITWLSLAVDYSLWGMNPRGYHLTNIILHAANAALFFVLAIRFLAVPLGGAEYKFRPRDYVSAMVAALLFSLHPMRVEVVSWISERRFLLSTVFGLGAVLAHLNGRKWLSLGSYALALLSHEIWVTLPLVLVVLDAYRERWSLTSIRSGHRHYPFFILAAVAAGVVLVGQAHEVEVVQRSPADRLVQIVYGLNFYLLKSLLPINLSPLYELENRSAYLTTAEFALGSGVLIATTTFLWHMRRRWPAGLAVWACYGLTLLPVLGPITSGVQVAADRYSYFSCMGWALIAGGGFRSLGEGRRRTLTGAAFALILSALGALTFLTRLQIPVWRDTDSLWAQALKVAPDSQRARMYLAEYLRLNGRTPEAIRLLEEGLERRRDCKEFNRKLGSLLVSQGRLKEALKRFRLSLDANQDEAHALNILGLELINAKQPAQASFYFRQAVERVPTFVDALCNWGAAEAAQGRPAQALRHFEAALRFDPEHAMTHGLLGTVLAQGNKVDAAIPHLRKALLTLDRADLHNNMGLALAHQGQTDAAIEEFQKSLRIDPRFVEAWSNLGVAFSSQGRHKTAIKHFRSALRLNPNHHNARKNMDVLERFDR